MLDRASLILVFLCFASCSSVTQRAVARAPEARHSDAAAAAPQPSAPSASEAEAYATIGDTILLSDSFNQEVLTLRKKVDIDGTILLPELGALPVAGYTAAELENLLRERYAPFFERLDLRVRIENTAGQGMYFIYGEVGAPGEKRLLSDTTILEAVMAANPDAVKADLAHVRVIRAQTTDGQGIDLTLLRRIGDSSSTMAVQPLDIIYVPPTWTAELGYLLDRFRAWIREWILWQPILIAGEPSR